MVSHVLRSANAVADAIAKLAHVGPKQFFFLSVKTKLFDFVPKLKWDSIVILNNISWVHILLREENNVVYSFAQIE